MIYTAINKTSNNINSPITTFLKVHKVYFTCFLAMASGLTFFNIHFICNALINLTVVKDENNNNMHGSNAIVDLEKLGCDKWEEAIYNKNCFQRRKMEQAIESPQSKASTARIWNFNPLEKYNNFGKLNVTNFDHLQIDRTKIKPWKVDEMKHSTSPKYTGEMGAVDRIHSKKLRTVSKWQAYNPNTCNSLHEIDMSNGVLSSSMDNTTTSKISFLSKGSQRGTWIVQQSHATRNNQEKIILKTFLWGKDFTETKYRLQRIDAIATERLTSSPYVVDGYAFCGMSILNEFANDGDLHSFLKHSYTKEKPMTSMDKLILARDSAMGLRDIHGIDRHSDLNRATLLHRDIRPHNFLVIDGKLKFHDFNNAQLLLKMPYENEYYSFARDGVCANTESEVYVSF